MLQKLINRFTAPLMGLLLGLFLVLQSYMFYQVNSFKLAVALAGGAILLPLALMAKPAAGFHARFRFGLLLLIPTLVGLPGALIHGAAYNFNYEIATDLICLTWALALLILFRRKGQVLELFSGAGLACVLLTLGILGHVTGFFNDKFPVFGREALTFGNPNYGAGVLMMLLCFFTVLALPQRRAESWLWAPWQRMYALFALCSYVLIFYVGSRAGIGLGTMGAFTLIAICVFKDYGGLGFIRQYPKTTASALSAGTATIVFILTTRWQEVTDLFSSAGWEGRLLPWKAAWDSFLASPVFGHGIGSSYTLFFAYKPVDSRLYAKSPSYNHAHNEHLQILQENGLVGYLLILLPLLMLGFLLLRKWWTTPKGSISGRLALGLAGGIAIFYMHGLFSVAQRMVLTNLPLYLMVACSVCLLSRGRGRTNQSTPQRPGPAGPLLKSMGAACWLGAIFFLFPWLQRQHTYSEALGALRAAELGTGEAPFIEKLKDLDDVYALHHAAVACTRIADFENGLRITERIERLVPLYRNTDFIRATFLLSSGQPGKTRDLLDEVLDRDRYSKNALPGRIAFAAIEEDFATFKFLLTRAMEATLLKSPAYASLWPEDASIVLDTPIPGLVEITDGKDEVEMTVNPLWIQNVFNVFGQRFSLNLDGKILSPLEYTYRLMAYSTYVKLPYIVGMEPSAEENQFWHGRYTEYQNLRSRLKQIDGMSAFLRGENEDIVYESEKLKAQRQSAERALKEVQNELSTVIDLKKLEQRHVFFTSLIEFVQQTETFSNAIVLSMRLEEQANGG